MNSNQAIWLATNLKGQILEKDLIKESLCFPLLSLLFEAIRKIIENIVSFAEMAPESIGISPKNKWKI